MTTTKPETIPETADAAYVEDTRRHIDLVGQFIERITTELGVRSIEHDASKFKEPERSIFSAGTERRDSVEYGSDAYKQHMQSVEVALRHHYANNRHHPEWHDEGITGMNLVDVIEMLCDWMAASMRDADGDPSRAHHAIAVNQERFGYSDEIAGLMHNTVTHLLESKKGGGNA